MDKDEEGRWTAFFIDFTFEEPPTASYEHLLTPQDYFYDPVSGSKEAVSALGGLTNWPYDAPGCLDFTTEVSVWPNTFPYEDCAGVDCYGTLL